LTVMQREQQTPPNSSPKSTAPTIVGMTKLILLALSCIATSTYLYVALSRISFPFAVEWVEASTFIQVVQILKGKPIYTYPSFDFIPTIYYSFLLLYRCSICKIHSANHVFNAIRFIIGVDHNLCNDL
jgi:hypothetical protein